MVAHIEPLRYKQNATSREVMPSNRRQKSREQATRAFDRTTLPSSLRMFWLPATLTVSLGALAFLPRLLENTTLHRSVVTATIVLLAWQIALYLHCRRTSVAPTLQVVLRPQHYVQALVQGAVFIYWGWYWQPVFHMAWLLVAQLLFAYVFDMLISWTRRNSYTLGFGPFPIIFSTNLFLWFKDDWFYLQFLMIAVGFMGKEYVKWSRDGRLTHIFNPSAFSLGLFSLILIATNTTELTWAEEIATTLVRAPSIYLFLFLIGLVVMYFFSITLVAGSAAIVLFGSSALYSAVTGVPYFIDSEIPAAVFLGLHLLVTDPSTSPKTPIGKSVFGVLYGLGVFGLYSLLGALGAPTFYDKLLCVPLLNLSVQQIDRTVQFLKGRSPASQHVPRWTAARTNLACIAVWILFFGVMTTMGRADGKHTGDSVPFWQRACADGRHNACERLMSIEAVYCDDNSAWACNEVGGHYTLGRIARPDKELAAAYFSRACELRFQAGCVNLLNPGHFTSANPKTLDLRLLLRERKQNLMEMSQRDLYARACRHDWTFACIPGIP